MKLDLFFKTYPPIHKTILHPTKYHDPLYTCMHAGILVIVIVCCWVLADIIYYIWITGVEGTI